MSGRYSRTYGRKKPAPPPISQYDKLVAEPGNKTKPSATKTAGHVGKWGMTSFTSLRNINGGYGKEESGKRSYLDDSPPSSHTDDPFSFDSVDTTNGASHTTKPVATYGRPRKFFKSRGPAVVQETPKPGGSENKQKGTCASSVSSTFESSQSSISGSDSKDDEIKSSPQYSTFDNVVPVSSGSHKSSDSGIGNHNVSSVSSVEGSRGNDDGGGSGSGGRGGSSGSGSVVSGSGGGGSGTSTGNVTKSSSGIKLKIFKSRSVTSSSQEVYSSTVELPSDDSRANSGASTPSTQDIGEDSKDSLIDDMPTKYSLQQYKNPQITSLINKSALETSQTSLNSSLDSSIEYSGLIDQRTGLLITSTEEESDLNNSCRSSVSAIKPYGKITDTSRSDINDCQFSELACIDISTAQSNSRLDLEDSSDLFSSSTFPEDFETFSGNVDSLSDPSKTPPIDDVLGETKTGGESKLDSDSPSFDIVAQKDNFDLFSNDFDENDIVDRTQIDFQSDSNQGSKDQDLLNTDTQDLDDFELFSTSSQGSHASESYSRLGKRPGLAKYSSLDAKKLDQPTPMVKKRSIFKSRDVDHDAKKRATYKHKWHDQDEKEEGKKESPPPPTNQSTSSTASPYDDFDFDVPATLKRVQTWPTNSKSLDDSMELEPAITSVKCSRAAKQYYTVVKNVKKTHQLQESGEFQEFNDDVEYFLDALRPSMPVSTRCLAALNLAQKCMVPAFRMHLRAHGTVIKFFSALSDAHADSRTALCAATVMFVLSQDRLNMDLDRDSLELMLNLLDTDAESQEEMSLVDAGNDHNKKKIRELCRDMQKKGHAKHLNLDTITAGQLAMETLLSLTSKRAGEWFKEELRELGGVDHLVRTITQCNQHFTPDMEVWTHTLLEKLSKVDRCLKVLENVTHQNRANQEYLLTYDDNSFPVTLMALYRLCHIEVPLYLESDCLNQTSVNGVYTSQMLVQTLITTKKVLINLTHSSQKEALGSKVLGCQQELYDITLSCLLIMPRYLAVDKKFEVQVLSCCLLLNLVEHSRENRTILMKTKAPELFPNEDDIFGGKSEPIGAMEALVNLFYKSEESAREQEAHTDQIIDNDLDKPDTKDEEKLEEIEETVTKLLQKAGRHMEDTLIAAYTALLTGYCIMEDEDREAEIRSMLPEGHFRTMVTVLKKFLRFMDLTATTSLLRSLKPTERVVKYMEKLDVDPEAEAEEQQQQEQLQLQQQLQQQALQQQQLQQLQQQQLQQQQLHEQPFMQLHSDLQQQQLQQQMQDQHQHLDDQLLEDQDEAYAFGF